MKGRRERRYLTEKYQARQLRLGYRANLNYPYDEQRHLQRPIARKKRFLDILSGNYTTLSYWGRQEIGLDNHYSQPGVRGRLKRHSFDDCGRTKCISCGNPRKVWGSITLPERRVLLHLKEEIEVYKGEKDEKVKRFTAR